MMMLVMAMAGTGFAAVVTLSDSDFETIADWQGVAIASRNDNEGSIDVTSTIVEEQSGELNAEMVIGTHTGGRYLAMGAMYVGGTFDPSTAGAITGIDFGFDCAKDAAAGPFIRPLLEQGGNYYVVATGGPQNGGWKDATVNLTGLDSSDWDLVLDLASGENDAFDDTDHPDFTGAGNEITFGIWLQGKSSTGSGTTFAIDNDLDNFAVFVDYVPEPATMALLGLGGLLIRKRK
jgi:hypothetical protein